METVAEIRQAERDRLERATRYEALIGQQLQLRATIAGLDSHPINVDALRRILDLTVDVPAGLMTRSKQFMPGGFDVRETLATIAADAVATAQMKAEKRDTQLTNARTALANVEVELSALARTA
jgi:hypothetical protein